MSNDTRHLSDDGARSSTPEEAAAHTASILMLNFAMFEDMYGDLMMQIAPDLPALLAKTTTELQRVVRHVHRWSRQ